MSIHSFLKTDLPIIDKDTRIEEVTKLIKLQHLSHVPISNLNSFIGMLSKKDIYSADKDEKISSLLYELEFFFAKKDAQWEEIMELFAKYDSNIIPILNEEHEYIGYYLLSDFIHLFANTPFLKEAGTFIVLEKNKNDYSFSEIAQIVESNESHLLGIFISDYSTTKIRITLKIITQSLSEILQTFRRYNYSIILEKEDDLYLQELKKKSDYFEKYISF